MLTIRVRLRELSCLMDLRLVKIGITLISNKIKFNYNAVEFL